MRPRPAELHETETETETKKVVSRPHWSPDLNIPDYNHLICYVIWDKYIN